MSVFIFTGPTISPEEARQYLDAVYLPPVSQGDVYRVARKQPQAIGIIDGYFERIPSVWHKEILWAMHRGIHVFGSASMGALRAAELDAFGMEGVGAVFEAFRDGRLEDDDEVAVAHGSAEVGYRGGSEAMVNIRFTLEKAEKAGIIGRQTHEMLLRIAKDLFYPDRFYSAILQQAAQAGLPDEELRALGDWLPNGALNPKRDDAIAMIRVIEARRAQGLEPKQVSFRFEHTIYWDHVAGLAGALHGDGANPDTVLQTELLEELRLEGSYGKALQGALTRFLAGNEMQRRNITATGEMLQETGDRFRNERNLRTLEAFEDWLQEHDFTADRFTQMVKEEVARRLVERSVGAEAMRRLPDQLHMSGEYDRLVARANDKRRVLEAAALYDLSPEDAGLSEADLMRWYFEERLRRAVPSDLRRYARDAGFDGAASFKRAVLREFCYLVRSQIKDTRTEIRETLV